MFYTRSRLASTLASATGTIPAGAGDPQPRAQQQRIAARIRQQRRQRRGIGHRRQHHRIQPCGIRQRLIRAGQRHQPGAGPQRGPCRQPRRTALPRPAPSTSA